MIIEQNEFGGGEGGHPFAYEKVLGPVPGSVRNPNPYYTYQQRSEPQPGTGTGCPRASEMFPGYPPQVAESMYNAIMRNAGASK